MGNRDRGSVPADGPGDAGDASSGVVANRTVVGMTDRRLSSVEEDGLPRRGKEYPLPLQCTPATAGIPRCSNKNSNSPSLSSWRRRDFAGPVAVFFPCEEGDCIQQTDRAKATATATTTG